MPPRPLLIPVSTSKGHMVSVPEILSDTGKRQRRYFRREKDAEEFAKRLRGMYHRGERGAVIPVNLAIEAKRAQELLEPLGMTLYEAAKAIVEQHEKAGGSETLTQRHARATAECETIWSDRYSREVGKIPTWAGKDLMATRCSMITPEIAAAAIRKNGAKAQSTVETRLRIVMAAVNYKTRHRKTTKINLLTVKQSAAMLRACETPEERRVAALLLFAGIRPSVDEGEITRLDWSAVGKSEIYISHEVAKTTNKDRHIPITPRLRRLLRDHPKEGTVIPARWAKIYQRIRKAAGLTTEQDITRHTFASNFLAAYGEKATKDAMGHTAGSSTLFRHYRRAVTEKAGKKYFGEKAACGGSES